MDSIAGQSGSGDDSYSPSEVRRKGFLDRALSIFAPVHAGEGSGALLLAANIFLLLAAYYILKTVRESLILSEGGAEIKSYSAAGQALLLLFIVPAYGAFASKVNRIRLISWVTLFFISHLFIFWLLGASGTKVGVAFFLWLGIFNLLVTAQFWAFANDLYSEAQGKRLFPVVGVGASLGALVGSGLAARLFATFGPYQLMVLSAVMLLVCIFLSYWVHRHSVTATDRPRVQAAEQPLGKEGGFRLIIKERYLLLIALLMLVLNVVNTTGEFIMSKLVVLEADRLVVAQTLAEAQRKIFIGEFYGDFYSWQNLLGLLFQLFLVSRIFKYIGVRGALFILPCLALGSYGLVIALPLLSIVRVAKIMENGTDYSIQNTTRHALFLPTSREAKYKAKAAIDTFFWRTGDMLQAGVVYVGVQLAFSVANYAMVNASLVAFWLLVVALIYREHRKITEAKAMAAAA